MKKPFTIEINGEPEDIERFMKLIAPGPTAEDKRAADLLWGKKKPAGGKK